MRVRERARSVSALARDAVNGEGEVDEVADES